MFKKTQEKIDTLQAQINTLKEEIRKTQFKVGETEKWHCGTLGMPYYTTIDQIIPIIDVIHLILDKMGLEVKSVPAQKEKFVLGKKEGK
jgi:hypothetical protein